MDEVKSLLKILNAEVRKIREGAQDGCGNSSPRGAQALLGRKLEVVSNDLPHSKQLNILSLRFLDKRKGYKKSILSHLSKSGQAILLRNLYHLKHAVEMTACRNDWRKLVWYACQIQILSNQLSCRLILHSVHMSSRKMGNFGFHFQSCRGKQMQIFLFQCIFPYRGVLHLVIKCHFAGTKACTCNINQ